MKQLFAIPAACLLLAGCGSGSSDVTVNEDGDGTGTIEIKSENADVNITAGDNAKVTLPEGFTLYPGAKVISNVNMTTNGEAHATLTMSSSASPDEIVAFYRRQAEAAGVEIRSEIKADSALLVSGTSPAGLTFSINAGPGDDGTSAHLTVVRKTGG